MAIREEKHRWVRLVDAGLLAVLSASAFYLTFKAGERGFYPFDQSILFDGSYRILSGQVPYKDFVLPFGPMAFWLHALFFKMFGVSYSVYLIGAGVINALAALSAVVIIRLLFPACRFLSYMGAVLVAVWFYPPFGTPWVDQTAFFFSFLGIAVLLWGLVAGGPGPLRRYLVFASSGCFALAAFISKQNVGAFMAPLYPLLLGVAYLKDRKRLARALGAFGVGLAAGAGCFIGYLHLRSDIGMFTAYFFEIPSHLGAERLAAFLRAGLGLLRPFFGGRGSPVVNVIVLGSLATAVAAVVWEVRCGRRGRHVPMRLAAASTLCIYCILFQHLFINTTLNQPENGMAFAGLIFATALGLAFHMAGGETSAGASQRCPSMFERKWGRRSISTTLIIILVVLASVSGIRVAMSRKVHDIFSGSEFHRPLPVEKLKPLRWASPTQMGGFDIRDDTVVSLYRYLEKRHENFFIFPDFTFLYALIGVPSPQPVLWFHDGITYSRESNSDLDRWIVEDLEENGIQVFVIEQVSWFNTGERLADFPQMKAYLMANFTGAGQIGTFTVYERKAAHE